MTLPTGFDSDFDPDTDTDTDPDDNLKHRQVKWPRVSFSLGLRAWPALKNKPAPALWSLLQFIVKYALEKTPAE